MRHKGEITRFRVRQVPEVQYLPLSSSGAAIAIGRLPRRRWWSPLPPCRRASNACLTLFSRRPSAWTHGAQREDQLQPVDLVVLRPDLGKAEASHDRERRLIGGRHRGEYLLLALRERPFDQRSRRLFRE